MADDRRPPPKRHRHGAPKHRDAPHANKPQAPPLPSDNPFADEFIRFRDELDEHHDRRERIIKASRDVTALSKKIIFSLQRARNFSSPLPDDISSTTTSRLSEIASHLSTVSPDLQGLNSHRYQRQLSPGLQELTEALCFRGYITRGSVPTLEEIANEIPHGIILSPQDYILGVLDFIGEVMRFAITLVALRGSGGAEGEKVVTGILGDLRELRTGFEGMDGGWMGRDAPKKMDVMRACVQKVENAVCGVVVRGSEMPPGWVPDLGDEDQGYGGRGED